MSARARSTRARLRALRLHYPPACSLAQAALSSPSAGAAGCRAYVVPLQSSALVAELGGLQKLEELQNHKNEDIYNKVVKMIETYFGVEEEGDGAAMGTGGFGGAGMPGGAANGTFSFDAGVGGGAPGGQFSFGGNMG